MAYRRQTYKTKQTAAAKRKLEKTLKKLRVIIGVTLLTVAVVLGIAGALGVPMPAWASANGSFTKAPQQTAFAQASGAATKVYFIDVGQGDAVLLEQDGEFCLIDAGTTDSADELCEALSQAGVQKLSLLVLTHGHADHIGGVRAVLKKFAVEQVVMPDLSPWEGAEGVLLQRTLEALMESGAPMATAEVGESYALGSGTLTVLSTGVVSGQKNDFSLVTMFEAPGMRYLSCGDAEKKEVDALLKSQKNLRADVYKATHHGAQDGNPQELLQAVRPSLAVVSCGANNSFGHPHREAMAAFAFVGAQVYRTDEDGTVLVYVNEQQQLCVAGDKRQLQQAA